MMPELQIIARLRAHLNSSDLTATDAFLQLYNQYLELYNNANQRIYQCDELLQRRMKLEAMNEVKKNPHLLELVSALDFAERPKLDLLVELYDWQPPAIIDVEKLEGIRRELNSLQMLQPLLAEYRRISRSNSITDKLEILRQLVKVDASNAEWKAALEELENKYLAALIKEAQEAIENGSFERLEEIYKEMVEVPWLVNIPTMVLQKVSKYAKQYREKCVSERAEKLLEKINAAYSSFDVNGLESLMEEWNLLCEEDGYQPTQEQLVQLNEAKAYLEIEQQEKNRHSKFQETLGKIVSGINGNAPIEEIERLYSEAESLELEIPESIVRRTMQYKEDCQQAFSTRRVLSICKILSAALVVLVLVILASRFAMDVLLSRKEAAKLEVAIHNGSLEEAKAILEEVEDNYPRLSKMPEISTMRGRIAELEAEFKDEHQAFEKAEMRLDELLQKENSSASDMKLLLAQCARQARSKVEKRRVDDLSKRVESRIAEQKLKASQALLAILPKLKSISLVVDKFINERDYANAEKRLLILENEIEKARSMPGIDKALLYENREVFALGDKLRFRLDKCVFAAGKLNDIYQELFNAQSIYDANLVLEKMEELGELPGKDMVIRNLLKKDIAVLLPVFEYATGKGLPEKAEGNPFVGDLKSYAAMQSLFNDEKAKLERAYMLMLDFARQNPVYYLLYEDKDGRHAVYHNGNITRGRNSLRIVDINSTPIEIIYDKASGIWNVAYGDTSQFYNTQKRREENSCTILVPEPPLNPTVLRSIAAPYQIMLEQLYKMLQAVKPEEILAYPMQAMKKILEEEQCPQYWKMMFVLPVFHLLNNIGALDTPSLKKIMDELDDIKNNLADKVDNPLGNSTLERKLQQVWEGLNMAELERAVSLVQLKYNVLEFWSKRHFKYVGTFIPASKGHKFAIHDALHGKSGRLWCMTDDFKGCRIVGCFYDDGRYELFLPAAVLDGHVIFTNVDISVKDWNTLKTWTKKLRLAKQPLPSFIPTNMN